MDTQFDEKEVAKFENETWSRCAAGYMEGFGALVGEAVEPLLDAVTPRKGERFLDVGTGPGIVAAAAAKRGAAVVGIDFSDAMLAEARKRHAGIDFHAAPAEQLPFDDGEFDAVAGNFVLHHSGNPKAVLTEALRVLKPGGRAAFTVWGDLPKLEAFGLFFAAVEEHAGSAELPHGPLFGVSDPGVLMDFLGSTGFGDPMVTEIDIAWRTPNIDSYLGAFRDWANLAVFPPEVRGAIESTVRERAESYRNSGQYVLPNPAIMLSAVK